MYASTAWILINGQIADMKWAEEKGVGTKDWWRDTTTGLINMINEYQKAGGKRKTEKAENWVEKGKKHYE